MPPPVYAPEEVAEAILFAAEHPKRDIFIGSAAKALSVINRVAPGAVDRTGGLMSDQQRGDRPVAPTKGSLYEPGEDGHVHGPFEGHIMQTSAYTRASMHPWATALVFGAIAATTLALMTGEAARHRLPRH